MYENDYILRMTQQLSEFLAQIVFNKKIEKYHICHDITNTTLKNVFGINRELLIKLPASSILDLISTSKDQDNEIILSLSKLMLNEGEVFQSEKMIKDSEVFFSKSIELLELIISVEDDDLSKEIENIKTYLYDKLRF